MPARDGAQSPGAFLSRKYNVARDYYARVLKRNPPPMITSTPGTWKCV